MTSLCSTAAPDCLTGQSKGRYQVHGASVLSLAYFFIGMYQTLFSYHVVTIDTVRLSVILSAFHAYSLNLELLISTRVDQIFCNSIKLPKMVISKGCYCFFQLLYLCQHFISANSAAYSLNLKTPDIHSTMHMGAGRFGSHILPAIRVF